MYTIESTTFGSDIIYYQVYYFSFCCTILSLITLLLLNLLYQIVGPDAEIVDPILPLQLVIIMGI